MNKTFYHKETSQVQGLTLRDAISYIDNIKTVFEIKEPFTAKYQDLEDDYQQEQLSEKIDAYAADVRREEELAILEVKASIKPADQKVLEWFMPLNDYPYDDDSQDSYNLIDAGDFYLDPAEMSDDYACECYDTYCNDCLEQLLFVMTRLVFDNG